VRVVCASVVVCVLCVENVGMCLWCLFVLCECVCFCVCWVFVVCVVVLVCVYVLVGVLFRCVCEYCRVNECEYLRECVFVSGVFLR